MKMGGILLPNKSVNLVEMRPKWQYHQRALGKLAEYVSFGQKDRALWRSDLKK